MTPLVLYAATGKARVSPIVMFVMFVMFGMLAMLGMNAGESPYIDDARRGANHMPAFAYADTAAAAA